MGIGTAEDTGKAIELLTKVAEAPHGFSVAQRQLGIMYYEGVGSEQDYQQAVHWFQQASQQDDIEVPSPLSPCAPSFSRPTPWPRDAK
jgi:TPR repeat protein